MPPRKKARGGGQIASTPGHDDGDSMAVDTPEGPESPEKTPYDPLQDPWTDEQETSLFKGIIRWKPAGEADFSALDGRKLTRVKVCISTFA